MGNQFLGLSNAHHQHTAVEDHRHQQALRTIIPTAPNHHPREQTHTILRASSSPSPCPHLNPGSQHSTRASHHEHTASIFHSRSTHRAQVYPPQQCTYTSLYRPQLMETMGAELP